MLLTPICISDCGDCASLDENCQVERDTQKSPLRKAGFFVCFQNYREVRLLDVEVRLMVVDHTLANNLNGLKLFEHDSFAALYTNAVGEMVKFFAVRQRGTRRL